ncbi:MAG: class IV adenylate cyclase [Pyrinomonadaceae bacterium]
MAVEIEKKYRLTSEQRDFLEQRLPELGAEFRGVVFEENTLYRGKGLQVKRSVLRLRRIGGSATLTYKESLPGLSSIKHRREDETLVDDPESMNAILAALGFVPALVYEKKRRTWALGTAEIVLDELPFGLFMEIEGNEREIEAIEARLAIKELKSERTTYPQLTAKHGIPRGKVIEARFDNERESN